MHGKAWYLQHRSFPACPAARLSPDAGQLADLRIQQFGANIPADSCVLKIQEARGTAGIVGHCDRPGLQSA